jgi:hypothetical protein
MRMREGREEMRKKSKGRGREENLILYFLMEKLQTFTNESFLDRFKLKLIN